MTRTAEEAVRYLEEMYVVKPTFADPETEDVLQALKDTLILAYDALTAAEWKTWNDGALYCAWCGNGQHVGHAPDCKRQLALVAIRKE